MTLKELKPGESGTVKSIGGKGSYEKKTYGYGSNSRC